MKVSELIKILNEIVEKQGDGDVWIDIPDYINFASEFSVEDRFYQGNIWRDVNRCFLVVKE